MGVPRRRAGILRQKLLRIVHESCSDIVRPRAGVVQKAPAYVGRGVGLAVEIVVVERLLQEIGSSQQ